MRIVFLFMGFRDIYMRYHKIDYEIIAISINSNALGAEDVAVKKNCEASG